ncbi:cytochrome P450 monooxygenase 98 [Heterobasidion irregulare TC 32-1]|uniref:Cytochrome P450 monooxygenase 98 n=1 Tax=Heterobasidion irregulare (strain TC 32-1) TaxID=747525 RepID=W4JRH6_HETIT|nr:cytochrome P450 monooxygenase 98 [Heterobasidion irregulare TC 32-1]ETW75471.1 cytochrome P450 monooxygenase 98 [Heterobasidion irregulare TC 32-1]
MSTTHLTLTTASLTLLSLVVLALIHSRFKRRLPKDIQGPPSTSFWIGAKNRLKSLIHRRFNSAPIGNEKDIRYQNEVGDQEFQWLRQYGTAWRAAGCMGEEVLMVADPKGIQHILQGAGYNYLKSEEDRQLLRMVSGDGLAWVHGRLAGDAHRRQRKVMNPAFSAAQLRDFLPLFHKRAAKARLVQRIEEEITNEDTSEPVLNVAGWLTRVTMDVLGEGTHIVAGFGYEFGATDDRKGDLMKNLEGIFVESTLYPSKLDLIVKSFFNAIPSGLLYYVRHFPSREYRRSREWLDFSRTMARDIVRKSEARVDGKDVMSVLIRANASEDPKSQLSQTEVIDQIATLILAGTDTTSITASWILLEIARHPEAQIKIRDEIHAARVRVTARGDTEFTIADLEGLTLLQCAMKEGMRLHPITWQLTRLAGMDDVIPLANPITTKSGQLSSIAVRKGTRVKISICAYHRLPSVWGQDADQWNPARWLNLDNSKQASVGMYANLLNFSAGVRSCIGWRFSVIEQSSILASLLEHFEFALPDDAMTKPALRKPSLVMTPTVEGKQGSWLRLKVKSLA